MASYDSDTYQQGAEQLQGVVQFEGETWRGPVQLYTANGDDFYVYAMNGNPVRVRWKVFGESVEAIPEAEGAGASQKAEQGQRLDICKFCLEEAIVDIQTGACPHCINETM